MEIVVAGSIVNACFVLLLGIPTLPGQFGPPAPLNAYTDITAAEARAIFDSGADVLFLDVREPSEYNAGHIPGALNMPWNSGYLVAHHTELPEKPIIVYCQSGGRSALASQFLVDNGHTDISNMLGGYPAWVALPERTPTPTGTATTGTDHWEVYR